MAIRLDADGYTVARAAEPHLRLVVVIPCFDEPDVETVVRSLSECEQPASVGVEVIVVVNHGLGATAEAKACNQRAITCLRGSLAGQVPFPLHVVAALDLPDKVAGVGTARKIGMDLAAMRLMACGGARDGVIACLDMDCRVSSNYLQALYSAFAYDDMPGASLYFEHDFGVVHDVVQRAAIIDYELYLRYYIRALRFAGHAMAFHTIGSAMAVRPDVYIAQGGMNRRKAAEDFYFLQKIIALGGFGEINDLTVWPSARPSDRVPFGTGRAIGDRLARPGAAVLADNPRTFTELRWFFGQIDRLHDDADAVLSGAGTAAPAIGAFLAVEKNRSALKELRANVRSREMYRSRFFRWFNLFRCLRFAHEARDRFYPDQPLVQSCHTLLGTTMLNQTPEAWLSHLRQMDRNSCAQAIKMPE